MTLCSPNMELLGLANINLCRHNDITLKAISVLKDASLWPPKRQ
jgi:hypothetical protein